MGHFWKRSLMRWKEGKAFYAGELMWGHVAYDTHWDEQQEWFSSAMFKLRRKFVHGSMYDTPRRMKIVQKYYENMGL